MRTESKVRRLERRVKTLEREVAQLRRMEEADLASARSLLFEHLKTRADVEPLVFAARNDLPNHLVEKVLEEFDKKHWTVPVEDEVQGFPGSSARHTLPSSRTEAMDGARALSETLYYRMITLVIK